MAQASSNVQNGIQTAHGLAGLVFLAVGLILLFHFIGFRAVFVAGRGA